MANLFVRAAGRHAQRRGWLNVRHGFELLRSPEVPLGRKAAALSIGLLVTVILGAMEVPLAGLVGILLPILGLGFDLAVDGVELIVLPVLFGSIVLARMFPPDGGAPAVRRG
jgi:hypothetical protein